MHAYTQSLVHGSRMSFNIHSDNDVTTTQLDYFVSKFLSLGGAFLRYDDMIEDFIDDFATSDGYTYTVAHTDLLNAQPLAGSGLYHAGEGGLDIGALDVPSPDSIAPVLTSASATATGATTATASVTTDEGNGTLYSLASENATETASTIKAALSQSVTATGEQSISLSALDPETTYYVHFVHVDAASNESDVASTAAFTTTAIVYPEITATATAVDAHSVTAMVTTDTAGGIIYGVLTTSATVPDVSEIVADPTDTAGVTDADAYELGADELDPRTTYYWHIVHVDGDDLASNVVTVAVTTQDVSIALAFDDAAPAYLQGFLATSNLSMSDAELKALLDGA